MMKKEYVFLFLFLPFSILAQSYEIKFSLGSDFYEIQNLETGFELIDFTEAKIVREGFSSPMLLGVGLSYTFSQNYILSFEVDFNYLKYLVNYSRNYPELTNPFNIKTSSCDVPWVRLGTLVNFDYILSSYNGINFLIGAGIGVQVFSPAVSDQFLYETLLDKISELDTSNDINLDVGLAQKIRAGIKYNFINTDISLSAFTSYTFVSSVEYEAPTSFLSIKISLGYVL